MSYPLNERQKIFGATDRNRTGTPLRTSDFKSEAATYYATVALFGLGRKNRTSASCSQSTGDTISLYRVIFSQFYSNPGATKCTCCRWNQQPMIIIVFNHCYRCDHINYSGPGTCLRRVFFVYCFQVVSIEDVSEEHSKKCQQIVYHKFGCRGRIRTCDSWLMRPSG